MASALKRGPSQHVIDGLTFRGDFDSGRLGSVRKGIDGVYEVLIPADCEELGVVSEYRIWYFFSVVGGTPGERITCRIMNLHQVAKVYNHDLRPLVRVPSASPTWERLGSRCEFNIRPSLELQITFDYVFVSTAPVYFAFYYPFSYADCQRLLNNIERALPGIGAVTGATADAAVAAATAASPPAPQPARPGALLPAAPGASAAPPASGAAAGTGATSANADGIYYHRELLCHTPDGRRLELLTITSRAGMMPEREPVIDGLFPDAEAVPRVHRFRGKPGVFVSARVHPGETSASYMVHGLIAFLLQPRNPYARALRAAFVFKVVPMLNPDGVARGHFRLDQYGVNLNRAYTNPSPGRQPAIFAVKLVLKQMAALLSPLLLPQDNRMQRALNTTANGLFMYVDLHGYTARHGCYLLGNDMQAHKEARCYTFAHLLQLYTPQFNAFACNFGAGSKRHGVLASAHAAASAAKAAAKRRDEEAVEAFRRKMKISAELASLPRGAGGPLGSLSTSDAVFAAALSYQPPSPRGGSSKSALVLRQRYHKQHVGVADGPGIATAALALARSAVVRRALAQSAAPSGAAGGADGTGGSADRESVSAAAASGSGGLGPADVGDEQPAGVDDRPDSRGGGGAFTFGPGENEDSGASVTAAAADPNSGEGKRRRGSVSGGAAGKSRGLSAAPDAAAAASSGGGKATAPGKPPRARRSSDIAGAGKGGVGGGAPAGAGSEGVDLPPDPADEGGDDDDADSDSLASSMDSGEDGGDEDGLGAAAASGVRLAASNAPARAAAQVAAGTEMAQRLFGAGIENAGKPALTRPPSFRLGGSYSPVKVPWTPRTWSCPDDPLSLRGVGVARMPGAGELSAYGDRIVDPYMRYVTLLSEGVRTGPADAYMADAEYRKLTAEWRSMKARVGLSAAAASTPLIGPDGKVVSLMGKGKETQKGGAGRVRVYKEFGTTHSYTIECSCNLFSHANVAYRSFMFGPSNAAPSIAEANPLPPHASTASPNFPEFLFTSQYAEAHSRAYGSSSESRSALDDFDGCSSAPSTVGYGGFAASSPSDASVGPSGKACSQVVCAFAGALPLSQAVITASESSAESASAEALSPSAAAKPIGRSALRVPAVLLPPQPLRFISNPYMCQVDSLQPPVVHSQAAAPAAASAAAASPAGAVALPAPTRPGARQSSRVGGPLSPTAAAKIPSAVSSPGSISSGGHTGPMAPAFVPPFGLPVHLSQAPRLFSSEGDSGSPQRSSAAGGPAGVAASGSSPGVYQCAWGCCPFDPPAVFASVGRGLAFALLELAGGTVAREGPSIAHPQSVAALSGPNVPQLQSRLLGTVWRNVANLHRWSRIVSGADAPTPEELAQSAALESAASLAAAQAAVPSKSSLPRATRFSTSSTSDAVQAAAGAGMTPRGGGSVVARQRGISPAGGSSGATPRGSGSKLQLLQSPPWPALLSRVPPQNVDMVVFPMLHAAVWPHSLEQLSRLVGIAPRPRGAGPPQPPSAAQRPSGGRGTMGAGGGAASTAAARQQLAALNGGEAAGAAPSGAAGGGRSRSTRNVNKQTPAGAPTAGSDAVAATSTPASSSTAATLVLSVDVPPVMGRRNSGGSGTRAAAAAAVAAVGVSLPSSLGDLLQVQGRRSSNGASSRAAALAAVYATALPSSSPSSSPCSSDRASPAYTDVAHASTALLEPAAAAVHAVTSSVNAGAAPVLARVSAAAAASGQHTASSGTLHATFSIPASSFTADIVAGLGSGGAAAGGASGVSKEGEDSNGGVAAAVPPRGLHAGAGSSAPSLNFVPSLVAARPTSRAGTAIGGGRASELRGSVASGGTSGGAALQLAPLSTVTAAPEAGHGTARRPDESERSAPRSSVRAAGTPRAAAASPGDEALSSGARPPPPSSGSASSDNALRALARLEAIIGTADASAAAAAAAAANSSFRLRSSTLSGRDSSRSSAGSAGGAAPPVPAGGGGGSSSRRRLAAAEAAAAVPVPTSPHLMAELLKVDDEEAAAAGSTSAQPPLVDDGRLLAQLATMAVQAPAGGHGGSSARSAGLPRAPARSLAPGQPQGQSSPPPLRPHSLGAFDSSALPSSISAHLEAAAAAYSRISSHLSAPSSSSSSAGARPVTSAGLPPTSAAAGGAGSVRAAARSSSVVLDVGGGVQIATGPAEHSQQLQQQHHARLRSSARALLTPHLEAAGASLSPEPGPQSPASQSRLPPRTAGAGSGSGGGGRF